ncbi:MAG: glycosyltransferase family 4 protein [Vicinamibacterales bacterium]
MTGSPGVPGAAVAERPASPAGTVARTTGLRIGIVNPEAWTFLHGLHDWLAARHQVAVFQPRGSRAAFFRERILRQRLRRDLRAFLRAHDVVFFEWASDLLALASSLPEAGRCAIVTRLHRYELYTWADRIHWDAVDRVIVVSQAKARAFAARFPDHAAKTTVVPVGTPLDRFVFRPRPFAGVIGTLCHISPRKRIYDLLLALAGPLAEHPSWRVRIGGAPMPEHGDYDEAVRRLVRRLGLESRVTFDGVVERAWEWYQGIDVFVSHSYSEGLQVAPAEAMASGCYALSHDWDGADELLPDDCRYVTDAELAGRLRAWAALTETAREAERRRLRALAVDRFDAERGYARVDQVMRACAEGRA